MPPNISLRFVILRIYIIAKPTLYSLGAWRRILMRVGRNFQNTISMVSIKERIKQEHHGDKIAQELAATKILISGVTATFNIDHFIFS